MLCTVVKELSKEIKGDKIELRVDLLPEYNLQQIKAFREQEKRPLIFTLRKNESLPEAERIIRLEELASLKPDYMDLEADMSVDTIEYLQKKFPQVEWILSHHDFEEKEHDPEAIFQRLSQIPANYYKIALSSPSTVESCRYLLWLKKSGRTHVILVCMGEEGVVGRILAPFCGSPFTYASLSAEETVAPGQLSIEEIKRYFTYKNPKFYGLIGDPVKFSIGHITHNAVMKEHLINAVYVKMKVTKEDLPTFLSLAKALEFKGLSVTMPLKEEVLKYIKCEEESDSINTLLFEHEQLKGINTDGKGALIALEKRAALEGKKVILVGAGGTAKAILQKLYQANALVTLVNRDVQKGRDLAQVYQIPFFSLSEINEAFKQPYDVLIHATPESCAFNPDLIQPHTLFMEVTRRPEGSLLLQKAKDQNCAIIYGEELFEEQALLQFQYWFKDQASSCQKVFAESHSRHPKRD